MAPLSRQLVYFHFSTFFNSKKYNP